MSGPRNDAWRQEIDGIGRLAPMIEPLADAPGETET